MSNRSIHPGVSLVCTPLLTQNRESQSHHQLERLPVVVSWFDVPGVREAIEKYRKGQRLITITKDEPEVLNHRDEAAMLQKGTVMPNNGWSVCGDR